MKFLLAAMLTLTSLTSFAAEFNLCFVDVVNDAGQKKQSVRFNPKVERDFLLDLPGEERFNLVDHTLLIQTSERLLNIILSNEKHSNTYQGSVGSANIMATEAYRNSNIKLRTLDGRSVSVECKTVSDEDLKDALRDN